MAKCSYELIYRPKDNERGDKETAYEIKQEFEYIVEIPLPCRPCRHLPRQHLVDKHISCPESHQNISRHPLHVGHPFGGHKVEFITYDKEYGV